MRFIAGVDEDVPTPEEQDPLMAELQWQPNGRYSHPGTDATERWSGRWLARCPEHSASNVDAYDPYTEKWLDEWTCEIDSRRVAVDLGASDPLAEHLPKLVSSHGGIDIREPRVQLQRLVAGAAGLLPARMVAWFLIGFAIATVVSISRGAPARTMVALLGLTTALSGAFFLAHTFAIGPVAGRRMARTYFGANPEATQFFQVRWSDTGLGFLLLAVGMIFQIVALFLS